jgi:hypothetical protein
MISRAVHAERQANLRLLESLRVEVERRRKDLEAKFAAVPVLATAQYGEAAARVLGMSEKAVLKFWRKYRASMARMAGNRLFQTYYTRPPDARHKDDPEIAEAVQRANDAARDHDEGMLALLVAELFGGRVSYGRSEQRDKLLFTLEVLGLLKSVEEKHRSERPNEDANIQVRGPSKLLN